MYSSIDPKTDAFSMNFCTEAERLWAIERSNGRDSILNIAAAEFLCLGYLGHGRDHAILAYVSEASDMGVRMGLFGRDNNDTMEEADESPGVADKAIASARMHAAWGVFNWITLSRSAYDLLLLHTQLILLWYEGSCLYSIASLA